MKCRKTVKKRRELLQTTCIRMALEKLIGASGLGRKGSTGSILLWHAHGQPGSALRRYLTGEGGSTECDGEHDQGNQR